MGVDLGRLHITVPQLLLHSANIGPGLKQVSGKGMAQCVARNRLADTGITGRFPYQFVQVILIKVMTPQATTCRVYAQPGRREEIMPPKIKRCGWILSGKGVRQPYASVSRYSPVTRKNSLNPADVLPQRCQQLIRQRHQAMLAPLAIDNPDLPIVKIDILDPQAHQLDTPQAR